MNEIQDSGVNELLVRRFNIVDSPGPASTLAPEVMPVVLIAQPSEEEEYLRGVRIAAARAEVGAVVAQYPGIRLANPTGSRTLVIVDDVFLCGLAASQSLDLGIVPITTPLNATVTGSGSRDSRIAPSTTPQQTVAAMSVGNGAATAFATVGKEMFRVSSVLSVLLPIGIVLAPGFSFDMWGLGTGLGFIASIRWRERRAQPSELG